MKTMKDNYLQGNQSGNGLCSFQCFTGLERVNELVLDAFGVTAGISDLCVNTFAENDYSHRFLGKKAPTPCGTIQAS